MSFTSPNPAPTRTAVTTAMKAGMRALAIAVAGLTVACSASAPPAPAQTTASTPASTSVSTPTPDAGLPGRLVADVTGDNAFRHLEELQRIADANGGNRALGTPGYDASVEYVARTLRDAGYTVETPDFTARSFSAQDVRLTVDGAPIAATAIGFSPATPAGGITAPLAVLAQDETPGCEAADFGGVPAGAVVLVRRGTCPFGVKSTNAAAARAAAVLVSNNLDGPLDQATLGDANSLSADPKFVNAAAGDFHLAAGATDAIDKGVVVPEAGLDLDGQPHGAAPDLGADER